MRYQLLVVHASRTVAARLAEVFDPVRFALLWAPDAAAVRSTLGRLRRLDLAILDPALPDADGLALCREMKSACATLPVVVLAGDPAGRAAAQAAGADLVVTQPFEAEALRLAAEGLLAPVPRLRPTG